MVPSPNPEKKVKQEAPSALTLMIRMSILGPLRAARDRNPGGLMDLFFAEHQVHRIV
jgi:hypothetical protein